LKNYANAVPTDLEKYATTRLRKQLFGVEEEGVSFFDQRYDVNVAPSMFSSLHSSSLRLLHRIRKMSSITRRR
jgi:hypothetical protein